MIRPGKAIWTRDGTEVLVTKSYGVHTDGEEYWEILVLDADHYLASTQFGVPASSLEQTAGELGEFSVEMHLLNVAAGQLKFLRQTVFNCTGIKISIPELRVMRDYKRLVIPSLTLEQFIELEDQLYLLDGELGFVVETTSSFSNDDEEDFEWVDQGCFFDWED